MAGGGPLRPRVTLMPFEVVMAPAQPEPDFERMGREGFEPSTLGLRVRPDKLQRTTRHRNPLERGGSRTATNYVPRSYGDKLVRASVLAPNRSEPTQRKALLEAYIAANGYVCPGLGRPAHPS